MVTGGRREGLNCSDLSHPEGGISGSEPWEWRTYLQAPPPAPHLSGMASLRKPVGSCPDSPHFLPPSLRKELPLNPFWPEDYLGPLTWPRVWCLCVDGGRMGAQAAWAGSGTPHGPQGVGSGARLTLL